MTKQFDLLKKAHNPLFNCEPKKEYAYYEVLKIERADSNTRTRTIKIFIKNLLTTKNKMED